MRCGVPMSSRARARWFRKHRVQMQTCATILRVEGLAFDILDGFATIAIRLAKAVLKQSFDYIAILMALTIWGTTMIFQIHRKTK